MTELVPILEGQIKSVKAAGIKLTLGNERRVQANLKLVSMSMVDGKVQETVLQLGGAYCTMCPLSERECHDPTQVSMGFIITRTVEGLHSLADQLIDGGDTDEVPTEKGDYSKRQGLKRRPLTTSSNATQVLPVCHSKIHVITWVAKKAPAKSKFPQEMALSLKSHPLLSRRKRG